MASDCSTACSPPDILDGFRRISYFERPTWSNVEKATWAPSGDQTGLCHPGFAPNVKANGAPDGSSCSQICPWFPLLLVVENANRLPSGASAKSVMAAPGAATANRVPVRSTQTSSRFCPVPAENASVPFAAIANAA